ncbi:MULTISPECIES: RagB/SusD family nutrient uptake outer membrane protein [unclassified Proteiniphilum]|jgi:hypothetical protein|uniref:RagB/SusD family nutrient uptake outer membrane protein n=1 Tax=unclassified Proteiniphilum TaxID=2622718 RepID=UPI00257BB6D6|nr:MULTISPECIES: RagB/SusD family nutrient uptake outer membrane protein [unclassified Proteiniphilum]
MKDIKLIHKLFISLALIFALGGCEYLDVDKELAENVTIEEVFKNPNYTKQWYAEVYQCIPNYSEMGLYATDGFKGIWSILSGDVTTARGPGLSAMTSGFNAESAQFHKWWSLYKVIRQGQIFLAMAPESMGNPADATYISQTEMNRMKEEVKYFIAYSYFQLFELYGPVPIADELADPTDPGIDYARAPLDELINYIDMLLEEVINSGNLPESNFRNQSDSNPTNRYVLDQIARPTKTAALALRARLWVYAASPLFNGGFQEALSVTNNDGTRLFPDYDPAKWVTARKHLEALLSYVESKGYSLHVIRDDNGEINPHESIYRLYQDFTDEILWATGVNNFRHVTLDMEPRTTPRDVATGSFGNVGLFQEGVDAFFMANGLEITDPNSGYTSAGFSKVRNYTRMNVKEEKYDEHISNMYANREPRFYQSVIYEGRSWYQDVTTNKLGNNYRVFFSRGGGSDNTSQENPRTGYMLNKFKNRNLLNQGTNLKQWGRPWILFRLADFYLYYAEVLNEIDPNNPLIIDYLDKVRERAGIPGYRQLAEEGKKDIIGNRELQREAIQKERRVELFAEGNRYFDIRRWMTADISDGPDQQLVFTGMNMNVPAAKWDSAGRFESYLNNYGPGSYYERTVIENRAWRRAMLFYPVPYNEIQKSRLLVQNPLW